MPHSRDIGISLQELAQARRRLEEALGKIEIDRRRLKESRVEFYKTSDKLRTANISKQGPSQLLDSLAPREKQVLRLIAEGLSTKEIASRLQISFKTVDCYRTRLLRKANVHETASLVRLAFQSGLLSA